MECLSHAKPLLAGLAAPPAGPLWLVPRVPLLPPLQGLRPLQRGQRGRGGSRGQSRARRTCTAYSTGHACAVGSPQAGW